jgi:hypothetical protein
MPNSKKPGKGTSVPGSRFPMFSRGVTNWRGILGGVDWRGILGGVGAQRIYPDAILPNNAVDEFTNVNDSFCKTERVLPPGVPLDDDLVDKMLQNLTLWKEFSAKYEDVYSIGPREELMAKLSTNTELIHMEATYRWIQNKKK